MMKLVELESAHRVTLEEVLEARESRALRQKELLQEYPGQTLICFTLNIAGPFKQFPLAMQTFEEGVRLIFRHEKDLVATFQTCNPTGNTAYFVASSPPEQVKKRMLALEDGISLGRLFDIDVFAPGGARMSREDQGLALRRCLICSKPAADCGRNRTHSTEDILSATIFLMRQYFEDQYVEQVAGHAVRALLYEVSTTPKPGLVDRFNNGSHQDMDFYAFLDSTVSLLPYFRDAVRLGLDSAGVFSDLFATVRKRGMIAEQDMFQTTCGTNTHKGLIFSLGLLCAAAGQIYGKEDASVTRLLARAGQLACPALDDFSRITSGSAGTGGEEAYIRHGIGGIREEAAAGFPSVQMHGLPALRTAIKAGCPPEEAGCFAFCHLLAHVHDTNILHRSDLPTLLQLQQRVQDFLKENPSPQQVVDMLRILDTELISRNLSPGGCADLLAISWFCRMFETGGLRTDA